MTQVMQTAIEQLRALPEADQQHIALRILEYLAKLKDLRAAIQEGLDSGPATPWNKEEFLKNVQD